MKKEMKLQYHNERSILNNCIYTIIKIGKKNATLAPDYNIKLVGLPSFRQPFNIDIVDLENAIKEGIYTII